MTTAEVGVSMTRVAPDCLNSLLDTTDREAATDPGHPIPGAPLVHSFAWFGFAWGARKRTSVPLPAQLGFYCFEFFFQTVATQ